MAVDYNQANCNGSWLQPSKLQKQLMTQSLHHIMQETYQK